MKLFFSPGACSLAPHIVLLEAGLAFTTEQVHLKTKQTASGVPFRSINPKGYVPALELDDGSVLTEGTAIVQYLAELAPASGLTPAAGTPERYQLMEWLGYLSTELQKSFSPLFASATIDGSRSWAIATIRKRLKYIETFLAGRQFLVGNGFTVADIYLFAISNWADTVKLDLAPYPALMAYRERIAARPAVQQAMRDEGLIE